MKQEEQYIHSLTYSDVARAISRDFFRIFCVNTNTDVYVEFIPHENDEELDIRKIGKNFKEIVDHMIDTTYSADLDTVRTAVTKKNVLDVLRGDDSFTLDYRMMIDEKPAYVRLKATRVRKEDPTHILFALSDTDAHMQRLAIYERAMKKSLTYAAVSEALASDYVCIYYVNTQSDEYIEYNSSELYKTLNHASAGKDFFGMCRNEFLQDIYEEDRDLFLKAFDKPNLLRVLSVDRLFLLTFRVILEGRPIYVRLKVNKMVSGDDHHIVIGMSNVDASMHRIQQYEQMKVLANRDPLTGVNSKHAYMIAEERINREIEQGDNKAFAVAVCDVNGLKQINDTLGHHAGDQYIKDASALICTVFKHSPVYRIGGDEFAVLMKGNDYENRSVLLDELNQKVEVNQAVGDVVIAAGIAQFVPGVDMSLSAVFERADSLMYQRKAQLKSMDRASCAIDAKPKRQLDKSNEKNGDEIDEKVIMQVINNLGLSMEEVLEKLYA